MTLPATYEKVCALEELPKAGAALAIVGGKKVAMVRTDDGAVHAVQDECTHGAVSLSEGDVTDCSIECWLHGSRFDLRDGKALTPPATTPLTVYPVKIEGDDVYVSVAPSDAQES